MEVLKLNCSFGKLKENEIKLHTGTFSLEDSGKIKLIDGKLSAIKSDRCIAFSKLLNHICQKAYWNAFFKPLPIYSTFMNQNIVELLKIHRLRKSLHYGSKELKFL